ncbi:hypothetical protein GSI_14241 [Ganoderma sinense ZZ0214-1]|uniref:Uncharacterized protein n=1 Tax=Ganoderma sinense ZZ0214-1 TaxID=1077348 RepID=A0A2G8RSJ5_9APHY|nr:hypothetical protein GSI_14241 [Ganoderma sinense ZZ0214-1]
MCIAVGSTLIPPPPQVHRSVSWGRVATGRPARGAGAGGVWPRGWQTWLSELGVEKEGRIREGRGREEKGGNPRRRGKGGHRGPGEEETALPRGAKSRDGDGDGEEGRRTRVSRTRGTGLSTTTNAADATTTMALTIAKKTSASAARSALRPRDVDDRAFVGVLRESSLFLFSLLLSRCRPPLPSPAPASPSAFRSSCLHEPAPTPSFASPHLYTVQHGPPPPSANKYILIVAPRAYLCSPVSLRAADCPSVPPLESSSFKASSQSPFVCLCLRLEVQVLVLLIMTCPLALSPLAYLPTSLRHGRKLHCLSYPPFARPRPVSSEDRPPRAPRPIQQSTAHRAMHIRIPCFVSSHIQSPPAAHAPQRLVLGGKPPRGRARGPHAHRRR